MLTFADLSGLQQSVYTKLMQFFSFATGYLAEHLNEQLLLKTIIDAELTAPGFRAAAQAVIDNASTIFLDPTVAAGAKYVLQAVLDTHILG